MVRGVNLNKGFGIEELLRAYFLKAGYYVVRGVPFTYEGFDVTDIDIWLYSRASSVSREITIVDSKNKKTPQAIERIFWIKGLKEATGSTKAIVATTDKRQEVKDFGKKLDIVVLDGSFLSRLGDPKARNPSRLSDEEFFEGLNKYSLGKYDGDWKGRIRNCKSLLARGLSFDNCNEWLNQARFFAESAISNEPQQENALRCLYLVCSFVALAVDYLLKDLSFFEQPERCAMLEEGFIYGSRGKAGLDKVLDVAMGLLREHVPGNEVAARQVKSSVNLQLKEIQADILSNYFSRPDVARGLFAVAKEFEQLAMQREFSSHQTSSVELKSMLLCLMDFWSIDRTVFSSKQAKLF
ncbi:hypothetical protein [Pseudomonas sp. UBA7530]|uniref:hypothetical protein n=1 Tax=Pseudomonas sp. UBA7530 TaxID=1947341 RepID=UPI0025F764F3|nr:hypothetical protein [Pseudomonas sp. UBA7530]